MRFCAAFHASTSFVGPTLINNTFLNSGDDGIAIHGRYYLVVAVCDPEDPAKTLPLHASLYVQGIHPACMAMHNRLLSADWLACIEGNVSQSGHAPVCLDLGPTVKWGL